MSTTTHTNAISGRPFKAEEARALDNAMRSRRFAQPQWATFQQWKGSGRIVRKGEEGIACTGASGFTWKVYNVAQLDGEAEAARAPAPVRAPAPSAPSRKRRAKSAPESKTFVPSGAPSAPAVKAKIAVVVDNPDVQRTPRQTIKRAGDTAPMGTPSPLADTAEAAAEIQRLNKLLHLTEDEARALIRAFPTRRYFEPDEVAKAAPSATRNADAKRWLKLWATRAKSHHKVGALKTWAWLMFTGRKSEAATYIRRANARRPGTASE